MTEDTQKTTEGTESEKKTPSKPKRNILPIHPKNLQTRAAAVNDLNATVPVDTERDDLENPALWAHVAPKITLYAEIRCIWEDGSRMARVICTYADGHNSRFKLIEFVPLEATDGVPVDEDPDYKIVLRGVKKFCVQNRKTGKYHVEMLPSKADAVRWVQEYRQTLNR